VSPAESVGSLDARPKAEHRSESNAHRRGSRRRSIPLRRKSPKRVELLQSSKVLSAVGGALAKRCVHKYPQVISCPNHEKPSKYLHKRRRPSQCFMSSSYLNRNSSATYFYLYHRHYLYPRCSPIPPPLPIPTGTVSEYS
jgi:hypothetical protein